jgi:hypothetical protein
MSDISYSKCVSKENLLSDYAEEDELDINKHVFTEQKLFWRKWSIAIIAIAFGLLLFLTTSLFLENRALLKNKFQGHSRFCKL